MYKYIYIYTYLHHCSRFASRRSPYGYRSPLRPLIGFDSILVLAHDYSPWIIVLPYYVCERVSCQFNKSCPCNLFFFVFLFHIVTLLIYYIYNVVKPFSPPYNILIVDINIYLLLENLSEKKRFNEYLNICFFSRKHNFLYLRF